MWATKPALVTVALVYRALPNKTNSPAEFNINPDPAAAEKVICWRLPSTETKTGSGLNENIPVPLKELFKAPVLPFTATTIASEFPEPTK